MPACLRYAVVLLSLLGSACHDGLTPSEQDALALEGLWTSTDSLEADVGKVGVLELDLRATPGAFSDIGGSWTLGDRSGEISPGFTTPADEVILSLSGGAQVRGPWSGDVVSGIIDGMVWHPTNQGPTWTFTDAPVTLTRQR